MKRDLIKKVSHSGGQFFLIQYCRSDCSQHRQHRYIPLFGCVSGDPIQRHLADRQLHHSCACDPHPGSGPLTLKHMREEILGGSGLLIDGAD